ncbi:MAG: hypothetical protein BWY45_03496 [Euryarchaeota archaeon ADurb.Bin294]|jgi:uncharacterized membrane protein|nr:MAG: hypothetical protein BWY45_03496 [Euryarchaeota archaeon ADurb.Bin294]
MLSEVDSEIIQYLEEHSGRTLQKCLLSDLRARWNESYLHSRIRTLQSRGQLAKDKDTSGNVLLVRLQAPEVTA